MLSMRRGSAAHPLIHGAVGLTVLVLLVMPPTRGVRPKRSEDDPASLPDIDFDAMYYETALRPSEGTLIASTLDGSLVALNQNSGQVLWQMNDQPVVKSPYDADKPILPAFLPDPKDGSIYMIGGGLKDPLKKLPFTIPELVAASPCKSSDGILYTGKKVDTWFSVDRYTGARQGSISAAHGCVVGNEDQCPNISPANFLIGRTEYNIMMYDSRAQGRKWNITFFDYSSNLAKGDVGLEYDMAHFTDSSQGSLVTLDRRTGLVQWEQQIGSPIVAMFRLEGDGMVNVPFTSVSKETLINLMDQFNAPESNNELIGETKLFPTLYVGEHDHGLFAMQSLVDEQTLTISPNSNGPLLLEGPQNFHMPSEINLDVISDNAGIPFDPLGIPSHNPKPESGESSSVLLFGYYQVPEYSTIKLSPALTQLQLTSTTGARRGERFLSKGPDARLIPPLFPNEVFHTDPPRPVKERDNPFDEGPDGTTTYTAPYPFSPRNQSKQPPAQCLYDSAFIEFGLDQIKALNTTFFLSYDLVKWGRELVPLIRESFYAIENKELKVIAVLLFVAVYCLFKLMQTNNQSIHSSFRMGQSSVGSSSSQHSAYNVTANPVLQSDGSVRVGQIYFDPNQTLGKGCEGTFVYRGKFDSRAVAVKRVLAACFSIADREVDLLRESDEHPNVIRYFCMEQDTQFRYIALELCVATLQDLVDGKYHNPSLDHLTVLRQASQGLLHLHNLDIVHRDIKPQNVLISMPGSKGEIRAMISDFGLCKKLKMGRMSFSRRSGVAGTDGWIAPEIMLGHRSNTCAVDVFSLGCVFYYVLSKGSHPFGESFRRQANILANEFDLSKLNESKIVERSLIEQMILHEQSARPTIRAILRHPLFWSKEKLLNFLQDVSDRVDKEDSDSALLAALERHRLDIVRGNWHDNLDPAIQEDLRKHRSYNGKTVRDLLRAMRNKKHHYNELPPEIKITYGRIPDQYVMYWISRFPRLVIHSWHAMHCIKNEPTFVKYFDKNYDFLQALDVNGQLAQDPAQMTLPKSSADRPLVPGAYLFNQNRQRPGNTFFEPVFRTQPKLRLDDDNDDDGELFQEFENSGRSVVSRWSQIDTTSEPPSLDHHDHHYHHHPHRSPSMVKEDQEEEAEQEAPVSFQGPLDLVVPELKRPAQNGQAKIIHKVPQISSKAREQFLMEQVEKDKELLAENQPTWAEAARNISALDKIKATVPEGKPLDQVDGSVQCEEKEAQQPELCDTHLSPVNGGVKENGGGDDDSCDKDLNADDVIDDMRGGTVWILPPASDTPKKKVKKKKSKKG